MKKIRLALILMIIVTSLVGCNQKVDDIKPEDSLEDIVETEPSGEIPNIEPEFNVVKPLESEIDINNLSDAILPVSLNAGDIYQVEDGSWRIKATVYEYEVFNKDDVLNLGVGDTIVLNTKDVLINSIEVLDTGLVHINGGLENNGYDLFKNNDGVYYEQGYNDIKSFYSVGEIDIPLIPDFLYIDESSIDEHVVMVSLGDLNETMTLHEGYCTPYNTYLTIENGKGFELRVVYTP